MFRSKCVSVNVDDAITLILDLGMRASTSKTELSEKFPDIIVKMDLEKVKSSEYSIISESEL